MASDCIVKREKHTQFSDLHYCLHNCFLLRAIFPHKEHTLYLDSSSIDCLSMSLNSVCVPEPLDLTGVVILQTLCPPSWKLSRFATIPTSLRCDYQFINLYAFWLSYIPSWLSFRCCVCHLACFQPSISLFENLTWRHRLLSIWWQLYNSILLMYSATLFLKCLSEVIIGFIFNEFSYCD